MKILERGIMQNDTKIQIEEWKEDYNFMNYGCTLASYPLSKSSHDGVYSPERNQKYRFSFTFDTHDEAKKAFNNLLNGENSLKDYINKIDNKKYIDCI